MSSLPASTGRCSEQTQQRRATPVALLLGIEAEALASVGVTAAWDGDQERSLPVLAASGIPGLATETAARKRLVPR